MPLYFPALVLVTMLLTSLACGSSATRELSEAAQPTSDSAAPTQASGPAATAGPTEPPPSPVPEPEAIKLGAQGFGQDGQNVGYAFIVENPNPGLSVESSQYQMAAYDAAGAVVATDSGYIELLLPGQTLGVGGTLFLDEGVAVSKIEVQLSQGEAVPSGPLPTFTVDSVYYTPGEFASHASGTVTSPYKRDIENVKVSAIVYNAAGDIVESIAQKDKTYSLVKSARKEDALFTFKAWVVRVVDGDTLRVKIDLGFGDSRTEYLRLRNLDAPELKTARGRKAREFVASRLKSAPFILLTTTRSDRFDRYLADVFIPKSPGLASTNVPNLNDFDFLNNELLHHRLAVKVKY